MSGCVMIEYQLPLTTRSDGQESVLPCPECRTKSPDALEIWTKPVRETTNGLIPAALSHLIRGGVLEELRRLAQNEPALLVEVLDDRALDYTLLTCTRCGYKRAIQDIPIPLDVLRDFACIDVLKLLPNQ